MQRRTFGAHWLAFLGALPATERIQLTHAAKIAVKSGCTLFELACHPVNNLSAKDTAEALLEGGIREAAYCRFFPGDLSCGDPLGELDQVDLAGRTIVRDIAFVQALRNLGVKVRHMTGPSVFVLGKKYDLERDAIRDRICSFVTNLAPLLANSNIQWNIEYLRPGEDQGVIGGVDELCLLLERINHVHIKANGDVFHMMKCCEVPQRAIERMAHYLGYLHAHGSNRIVPGAYRLDGIADATDDVNWHQVSCALASIGYTGPVVPEPFGATIRKQVPALGEGLPPAIDPARYYELSREHLNYEGVLTY